MPGFFSRLFRRNPAPVSEPKVKQQQNRRGRSTKKETKKQVTSTIDAARKSSPPIALGPNDEEDVFIGRVPSFTATTTMSGRESSVASRDRTAVSTQPKSNTATESKKVSNKGLSPRAIVSPTGSKSTSGPVDLDDTDFEASDQEDHRDRSNRKDAGLSFQQLHQFNMQQQPQTTQHLYVMNEKKPATKNGTRTSDGLAAGFDDNDHSESSYSEFNLSTDAEDEEYNSMKRRIAEYSMGPAVPSHLNTSGMSSPTSYNTDDEHAIFPALQTDDEQSQLDMSAMLASEEDPGRNTSMASKEAYEDMRAWGLSPSTGSSGKENGRSPSFPTPSKKSPASDISSSRRKFTSPAVQDGFANFADFDSKGFDVNFENAFPDSAMPTVLTPTVPQSQRTSRRLPESDDPLYRSSNGARRIHSSSASAAAGETSLTDLLAQAKMVGRSRRELKSPSSVNSAPAISAQYLRQYHGLGSRVESKSTSAQPSVADIIQSLEETNATRVITASRSRSTVSVGSRDSGANASVRSAKERVRERRRLEREGITPSSRNRSRTPQIGSDESEEIDPSENWLFDEVTGALGPRGVSADMESLSGRSNRSKSSAGNKSSKSHRSHRSSARRPKTSSNESLDSRGSKNSRYSHKSTRSYLSQMSEQSRSVANDLLRLEMQLAMVGSQEIMEEGVYVRSGGSVGGSVGGNSRASRTSRNSSATRRSAAITKRNKITVVAPPGKLGIILANKADSKGTVVSGVRTSSVLAEKISPGDRIIAIDGEDVSRMTVSEITTIMARKSEFERTLTVLTTAKHVTRTSETHAPSNTVGAGAELDGSYSSFRR